MKRKIKNKINIIADGNIPFLKGVFEEYADIKYLNYQDITKNTIKDADALIIRTRTKCDELLLEKTNVKLIATATIGHDHIDKNYCKLKGIKWINAPGCNSNSVLQYVLSALFYLVGKKNYNLQDKTIGIIGVGNVGTKVLKAAEILGFKVLLNDPPRERKETVKQFVRLDKITTESDIITFHVPLNYSGIDKTFHLANESFFKSLKKRPILINTSRGEVIPTESLKFALENKLISHLVLDVWENEPNIDLSLMNMCSIATPHIAGYSVEGKANGTAVCVNAINDFFKLGLVKNWYPTNLPLLDNNEIFIDGSNKSEQKILSSIFLKAYNIIEDDKRLRISPSKFEEQRANYPVRHEYGYFNLILKNSNFNIINKMKQFKFNIKF